jgi:sodium-dependent dicarboxylate transporter 2/3/5
MASYIFKNRVKYEFLVLGILIFLGMVFFLDLVPDNPGVTITAAIAVVMALWWVTEALPIGITSLLPIILFPYLVF